MKSKINKIQLAAQIILAVCLVLLFMQNIKQKDLIGKQQAFIEKLLDEKQPVR